MRWARRQFHRHVSALQTTRAPTRVHSREEPTRGEVAVSHAEGQDVIASAQWDGHATARVPGMALGLVLAFGTTGLASQALLGVGARDPMVFTGVAIALLAVIVAAAFLPARRATMLDPIETLRSE